jgi:hypothetical protein
VSAEKGSNVANPLDEAQLAGFIKKLLAKCKTSSRSK